jgi:hypothetical protein
MGWRPWSTMKHIPDGRPEFFSTSAEQQDGRHKSNDQFDKFR